MAYNGPGYAPVLGFDLGQNPPRLKLAKGTEVSNPGGTSMEHSLLLCLVLLTLIEKT